EAGRYQVFATHPSATNSPFQCEFVLQGMQFVPSSAAHVLYGTAALPNQVLLTNLCDLAISGLNAVVQGAPAGLNIQVSLAASLPGSGSLPVTYSIQSSSNQIATAAFVIEVTNGAGVTAHLPVQV